MEECGEHSAPVSLASRSALRFIYSVIEISLAYRRSINHRASRAAISPALARRIGHVFLSIERLVDGNNKNYERQTSDESVRGIRTSRKCDSRVNIN